MSYALNSSEVEIIDMDYLISVKNKNTGEIAIAKNHNGYTNHVMYFSVSYKNKPKNLANVIKGRPEALKECLKHVGLPSFKTLKKHAEKEKTE